MGSARLKRDFALPYSVKSITNVRRKHGLVRKFRRKKHETKRCLREVKRHWRAFQQIDIDTKHLVDIPEYWPLIEDLGLPPYQYTARDVSTGAALPRLRRRTGPLLLGTFAAQIIEHLQSLRPARRPDHLAVRQRQRIHRLLAGKRTERLHRSDRSRRRHPQNHPARRRTASRPTSRPSTT